MAKNIKYRMLRELESQINMGVKRKPLRSNSSGKSEFLHSANTIRTYMQHVGSFGDYLRDIGLNKCSIDEAKEHAAKYITSFPSVSTQKTVRCALARVFHCDGKDICELESRRSKDIKRGRTITDRAAAIEKNHPEIAHICRSIGARHHREFINIKADDFFYKDGDLFCHIVGKGGRHRDAIVLDGKGKEIIENILKDNPKGPMFRSYSGANIHKYRADYAVRLYALGEKKGYSTGEIYRLRDGSGKGYDKGILDYVSSMLGHGYDRYYTVVHNYLSYGENKE